MLNKKIIKGIVSFLLIIAMTASLAACRKNPGSEPDDIIGIGTTIGPSETDASLADPSTIPSGETDTGNPQETGIPGPGDETKTPTGTEAPDTNGSTDAADSTGAANPTAPTNSTDAANSTNTANATPGLSTATPKPGTSTESSKATAAVTPKPSEQTSAPTGASHTHAYTASVTKEASCETKGVKTYSCSVCKASYTEDIPAKGHDWKKQTVHRDAVYGTRNITETRSNVTVYLLMYLNQKGIDAGLANNGDFGISGSPAYTVKIGEYWETNGDESTREWVYKWQNNSSNDISTIATACANYYMAKDPYKGCCTSLSTYSYRRNESHVVGTEEYVVTPAHDEEATICTRCGADRDLISFTSKIYQILISFKSKYPEGTSWTNEGRSYTSYTICPEYAFYTGYGCEAFTTELSDAAFGDLPRVEHRDVSRIRVGDILRINNNTHAVIVLEVTSSGVVVAEGNYNGKVHWGRVISTAELKSCLTYVWTRYPS